MDTESDIHEIGEDVNDETSAFFANLTGETQEAPEADTAGSDEAEPQAAAAGASEDPDDAEHEWGDEGAKVKAKLKDLKDAYRVREEATRAAQEAAQARTQATTQAAQASAALTALVQKASAKWEPFAKLDFLALSKDPNISSEDFSALRAAAQEALTDYRYLTTELEGVQKAQGEAQKASQAAEVQACIKELNDPVRGLPGFGPELYGKLVDHATTYGAPKDVVMSITAPWAIKLMNDAMLYRQGLTAATDKVQKVVNKATKVLRPGGSGSVSDTSSKAQAMKNLRSSGSMDDAAAAFLASFGA